MCWGADSRSANRDRSGRRKAAPGQRLPAYELDCFDTFQFRLVVCQTPHRLLRFYPACGDAPTRISVRSTAPKSPAQTIDRRRDKRSAFLLGSRGGCHDGCFKSHPALEAHPRFAPIPWERRWNLHQRSRDCRSRIKYQPVRRVEDMPECFSRPICRLAMGLNDAANDVEKQRPTRFVARLACADTTQVERSARHTSTHEPDTFLEGLQRLEGAWPRASG